MGFFSELKEDLSQAVNELVPEEGPVIETAKEEQPELENLLEPEEEESIRPETAEDLSRMLDNMDFEMAEETEEFEEEEMEEPEEITENEENAEVQEEEAEVEETQYMGMETEESAISGDVAEETAVITAGMKIRGDISSQGSLDVIGAIEGNIDILGKLNITGTIDGASKAADVYAEKARINGDVHSSASIKIGQNSIIIGNIYASSAVIAGAVKGDIDVKGPVILDTSAIVMGNIKSKSVQINNGAVIEGLCSQGYADVSPSSFFEDIKKARK
jgi:cytoskeletal protein CcmA (bactofilin family)